MCLEVKCICRSKNLTLFSYSGTELLGLGLICFVYIALILFLSVIIMSFVLIGIVVYFLTINVNISFFKSTNFK